MSYRQRQWYVLDGQDVVCVGSLEEWAKRFEASDSRVAATDVGNYWVSTTFLGLDHQYGDGPPLLFETMVFEHDWLTNDISWRDLWCERTSTWGEAEQAHARGCAWAISQLS